MTEKRPEHSDPAIAAEVARVRSEWQGVIRAMVAASEGHEQAAAQLHAYFAEIEREPQWQQLTPVMRRILAGEREAQALLPGLDPVDTLIVRDTLDALATAAAQAEQVSAEDLIQGLLGAVRAACSPEAPPGLRQKLLALTDQLANDGSVSVELRAYGRVLHAILRGERKPDLSLLSPTLADPLRALLDDLQS